jgi:hypothetical protein
MQGIFDIIDIDNLFNGFFSALAHPPEISYPLLKMVNLLYGIHIPPIR